ncbi:MAG: ral secretion pathway protein [Variibacter sp.]|jgi:general secretion pathway protein M|nr:ral secretion pathway protein [Variibacter sp.]
MIRQHARLILSASAYVALFLVSAITMWSSVSAVLDRYAAVQAADALLAQIEGRSVGRRAGGSEQAAAVSGSPFLEGSSQTVAAAALLQRVVAAINKVGGSVLSSQVELQKDDAPDGWVGLIVSSEIDHTALQPLLYDIEAGMPFLFVEQLSAAAPQGGSGEESRVRILLTVSGQWEGRK